MLPVSASYPFSGEARLASILAGLPRPSPNPTEKGYMLSLGCGQFLERRLLLDYWPQGLPIGLDRRASDLLRGSTGIVQADALNLPFPAACFGLILIRHPDLHRHSPTWREALKAIPYYLKGGGLLLITTYTLDEHAFVRQVLPYPRLSLPESQLAPPDLIGRDRYPAAYQAQF